MSGQTGPAYFGTLSAALAEAGLHRPLLVVDRDRLDANVAAVRAGLAADLSLRLVDKSLPVPDLLTHLSAALATGRFMTFHLPLTARMLALFPEGQFLFGKPMPAEALARTLATADGPMREGLSRRTVHLVDTGERLAEYLALAEAADLDLTIAFEVNVGMNRGGIANPDVLSALLAALSGHDRIRVAGIMGYEAHLPAIPGLFGGPAGARARSDAAFAAFAARLGPDQRAILNTGGSKTALGYPPGGIANEVSMGSAFVKPTDFDSPGLDALSPAVFIATPVLKTGPALLPGLPGLTPLMRALGRFPARGLFLYGGHFMGRPVHPPSMRENALWGHSSNQQFMAIGENETVRPGDFAFFRPTQSEAVLQQFGAIAVFAGGRIETMWEPFATG